jgi:hypothetical protein
VLYRATAGEDIFLTLCTSKKSGKGLEKEPQIPSPALSGSGSTGIFSAHAAAWHPVENGVSVVILLSTSNP